MKGGWGPALATACLSIATVACAPMAGPGSTAPPGVAGAAGAPLAVCMAEANPPLSYEQQGTLRGLDVRLAEAVAAELGRPLVVVPFESKHENDSTLSQEVNALLSSKVCELASGFALMAQDLGPPARPTARVPDYPGAPRPPQRAWVPLGTLVASRPYHAMAMSFVVREPSRAAMTLAEPGDARIGVVGGTLSGTLVSLYRNGRLRPQTVGVAQNEDVLAALEAGRFDAALVPVDRFDAWRLAHPQTVLQRGGYVHPLRINIGFVARSESAEVLAAADRVIGRAIAAGELARWSTDAGASWVSLGVPAVSPAVGWMDLLNAP